jgi:cyclic pyranopterin phosphate synthase
MNQVLPTHMLTDPAPLDRRARPLRDLRLSVIDNCNFRCPYCMPEAHYPRDATFLSARQRLTVDEIATLVRAFVGLGVSKVRLTGGEPLLRRDLGDIVRAVAAIDGVADLALTTNGALLAREAQHLRDAGLTRLTVSLDALDPALFARMSGGRGRVEEVLAGLAAAERAGFERIKINTVVERGVNEDEVFALLEHFRGRGHIVRFIETMDVGTCNGWTPAQVVPSRELVERIGARWSIEPLGANYRGEVAERWRFADGSGEFGFVSSVSAPFCGDCHRARVSADGRLYTCLFAADGTDLRGLIADPARLSERIRALWTARTDRYSEVRSELAGKASRRIEMYRIGG